MKTFLYLAMIALLILWAKGRKVSPEAIPVSVQTSFAAPVQKLADGLPPVEAVVLQDLQSVGLYTEWAPKNLKDALVKTSYAYDELEEAWSDAETDDENKSLRSELIVHTTAALHVACDWKSEAVEPLSQAKEILRARGYSGLKWGPEEEVKPPYPFSKPKHGGIQKVISVSYDDHTVRWRFQNVPGLMAGVNLTLAQAGVRDRFVELDTGGDSHVFVFTSPNIIARMKASELFPVRENLDPWAGRDSDVPGFVQTRSKG